MSQAARTLAILVVSIVAFVPSPYTAAQVAGPSFEVASVKRSDPSTPGQSMPMRLPMALPGGRWFAQNVYFRMILQAAYPDYTHHTRIVGGPSWIGSQRFDIDARAYGDPAREQLLLMVRNLLAERFSLEMHTEVRPVDVYALVRVRADGRVGPGLQPPVPCQPGTAEHGGGPAHRPKPGELPPCGIWTVSDNGIRTTLAGDAPLSKLLVGLQAALFDRPLLDRTGLEGTFSIRLEVGESASLQAGAQAPVSPATQLFTALREQLWLAVEPRREPMEVLVIDNVETPSEN
jgi:uncharacterized protein (TIGR03435 family)